MSVEILILLMPIRAASRISSSGLPGAAVQHQRDLHPALDLLEQVELQLRLEVAG
jgi:hypothetical protein